MRFESVSSPLPLQPQRASPAFRTIVRTVAEGYCVSAGDLLGESRGQAHIASARQIAMYLCHVSVGRSLTDVGRFFGRDRTTVAYACSLIEDRRDDPVFDKKLDDLERRCLSGSNGACSGGLLHD